MRESRWFALMMAVASMVACGGQAPADPYEAQEQLPPSVTIDTKVDSLVAAGEQVEHYEARYGEVHINKLLTSRSSHGLRSITFFIKVDRSKTDWGSWRFESTGMHQRKTSKNYGSSKPTVEDWKSVESNPWAKSDHYFSAFYDVTSNYHSASFEAVLYVKLRHTQDSKRVRYLWVHPGSGGKNFSITFDTWEEIEQVRRRARLPTIGGRPDDAAPTWWDELYRKYNPARLK